MKSLNKTRLVSSMLFLFIGIFSVSAINNLLNPEPAPDTLLESVSLSNIPDDVIDSDVLGEKDENPIFFTVNVPSRFKKNISAPNIVYSITGGEGIEVTDGQYPTLSNTGVLSLQDQTGDLYLTGGSGISVNGLEVSNALSFVGSGGTTVAKIGDVITVSSSAPDYTLSGWSKVGTSVGLTTATDSVVVDTLTFGNATITNGKSIRPDTDLGSDLGSAALRFNNLYVGNINSNSSTSTAGQATFTYEALSTALTEASVLINPTAPIANGQLLGLSVAGYQRALIDEDGDLTLGYNDAISAPASDYPLSVYGHNGTNVSFIDETGAAYFTKDIRVESVSGGAELTFGRIGTSIYDASIRSGNYNGSDIVFYDGTVPRMTISNSGGLAFGSSFAPIDPGVNNVIIAGKVGMGTTDTTAGLNVENTSGPALNLISGFTSTKPWFNLYYLDTSKLVMGTYMDGTGAINFDTTNSYTNSAITFRPKTFLNVIIGGNEAVRVDSSGNFGIGIDTPEANLHIFQDSPTASQKLFQIGTSDSVNRFSVDEDGDVIATRYMMTNTSMSNEYFTTVKSYEFRNTGVADHFAWTTRDPVQSEKMRLSSTGLLGIGTGASITARFQVSGTTDIVQTIIQANSTQTANLQEWQDSAGVVLGGVDERGVLFSDGGTDPTNFFAGNNSGNITMTGSNNLGFGDSSLKAVSTGYSNIAMGTQSLYRDQSGSKNIAIGGFALSNVVNTHFNTAIGYASGINSTGSSNIFIGAHAGYRQTAGSDLLIIDSDLRVDAATELTNSILYGVMDATATNQSLRVNGELQIMSGSVGIGTTSPVAKLSVVGTSTGVADTGIYQITTGTGAVTDHKLVFGVNDSGYAWIQSVKPGTGYKDLVLNGNGGNVGVGDTTPSYSLDVTGMMRATEGVVTYTKAGTISDVDFTETPIDGLMGVDSTNGRLYFRHGGAWHYVAQTAGFQIPEYETYTYDFNTSSFDTSSPLADGEFLIPFVEGRMSDGAIHGLYTSFSDVKDQLFADELARILSLEQRVTALEAGGGLSTNPLLSSAGSIGSIATWADNLWTFLGNTVFKGDTTFEGEVLVNSDTAGAITIPAGAVLGAKTFSVPYSQLPSVYLTPQANIEGNYFVQQVSANSFTIELSQIQLTDVTLNWFAIIGTN